MKVLIFVLLIFSIHKTIGQPRFCGSDNPLPDKIITIEEEIELKNKMDSFYIEEVKSSNNILKKTHRTTYGKPLDSFYILWGELKKLQTEIIKLSIDTFIDTSLKYKLLFVEDNNWRVDWNKNSYQSYNISQFDSVINGNEFFKKENQLFTDSYSYNNQYLIVEECHEYIGNSSWGSRKVHYFEKVKAQTSNYNH